MRAFLLNDTEKLSEVQDNIDTFQSAIIDKVTGNVVWKNHVDFDERILLENNVNVDFYEAVIIKMCMKRGKVIEIMTTQINSDFANVVEWINMSGVNEDIKEWLQSDVKIVEYGFSEPSSEGEYQAVIEALSELLVER